MDVFGTDFDLFVTALPSAIGTMTVRHEVADGGTFDAQLPVEALLTFTEVGNPLNTFTDVFSQVFESFNAPWSHTAPPGDVHNATFPAGDFYPGGLIETAPGHVHEVIPSTPEPSSLLLFGIGIFGTIGYCWRRRKQAA